MLCLSHLLSPSSQSIQPEVHTYNAVISACNRSGNLSKLCASTSACSAKCEAVCCRRQRRTQPSYRHTARRASTDGAAVAQSCPKGHNLMRFAVHSHGKLSPVKVCTFCDSDSALSIYNVIDNTIDNALSMICQCVVSCIRCARIRCGHNGGGSARTAFATTRSSRWLSRAADPTDVRRRRQTRQKVTTKHGMFSFV